MFLACQRRIETDHRSFGFFYFCCDEVSDISIIEALCWILTLAADQLKKLDSFCEKTASIFFDAIMDTALLCVGLSKSKNNLAMDPESLVLNKDQASNDGLVKSRKYNFLPEYIDNIKDNDTICCGQNKMLKLFTKTSIITKKYTPA